MQIPPMYSAVKVKGQKLCDLARKGREVERKARPVTVFSLEQLDRQCAELAVACEDGDILLEIRCSKGTYIRTLCHDIGQTLGCGGAMSALRRTRAGQFSLSDAHTLEAVLTAAAEGRAEALLLPVDTLFGANPALTLTPAQERVVRSGGSFTLSGTAEGRFRLYGRDGSFLALGRVQDGCMRTEKSFFEV